MAALGFCCRGRAFSLVAVIRGYSSFLVCTLLLAVAAVFVQSLSLVWLFATPWTASRQISLSFTVSGSLLKVLSVESVMRSNHLILCLPLLLLPSVCPSIRVFSVSQVFTARGQSIGASASASAGRLSSTDTSREAQKAKNLKRRHVFLDSFLF